ncbi:MAG: hybrid sensor histidine kinase/response regulator, partial [Caldilineae bacterium]
MNEEEFLKKLLETFKLEAAEHLEAMSSGLLALEKEPPPDEQATLIETVFREAHSLKGAARAVNLPEIESVCQAMESVFNAAKRGDLSLPPSAFDTLYGALDTIQQLLALPPGAPPPDIAPLLDA